MEYNTTREKLIMPEYGRIIQDMVDKAVEMEDKAKRQEYAELIVKVMANFYPQMRSVPGFVHKLWDHLAYMSGYKLDIDYPVEISKGRADAKPAAIPYPMTKIRFRHYGHLVESLLEKIYEMPESSDRDDLLRVVARRMRADLAEWRGEGGDLQKIAADISMYSNGKFSSEYVESILVSESNGTGAADSRNPYRQNRG